MDVFGLTSPDLIRIEDLLDLSNVDDDVFSSSSAAGTACATSSSSFPPHNSFTHNFPSASSSPFITDFTHDLCVPSEDAAHLEWLSQFVDDSFSGFPENPFGETMINVRPDSSFPGKPRSKRSRAPAAASAGTWVPMLDSDGHMSAGRRHVSAAGMAAEGGMRRCTHCASEKTPQWRTGPLGPKTLCNACGVRYKSGRLVPEYRPAASPTFVLTQHSNSHRKVMELRRQKELVRQHQIEQSQHTFHSQ